MRLSASILVLFVLGPAALGQSMGEPAALYAGRDDQSVRVTFEGLVQRYSDDGEDLTEVSVPLRVTLPIGRNVSVGLNASYAAVSGSDIEALSGLSDVQVVASTFQPVGGGSLVVSLGVNATTGSTALSFDEFRAATLAAQTVYDLRVPTFGQGLRVAPSVTYAFPAGETLALGVGASYQYRGPYEPLGDVADAYDPGEEVLLTAGANLGVAPTTSVSLDLSLGFNGTDSWGAVVYEPGNTFAATAQLLKLLGRHEVRVVARYRTRSEGSLPEAALSAETAVPNRLIVLGNARFEVSPTLRVGVLARLRRYGESALFDDGSTLTDLGLRPTVTVSERVRLTGRFLYTLGSFNGFTAGGGVSVAF